MTRSPKGSPVSTKVVAMSDANYYRLDGAATANNTSIAVEVNKILNAYFAGKQ
jgi:hypothetical protein